jgi:hypothetical protein
MNEEMISSRAMIIIYYYQSLGQAVLNCAFRLRFQNPSRSFRLRFQTRRSFPPIITTITNLSALH